MKRVIQYFEDGYGFRAMDRSTEATRVIILEWQHPNYGYWADFALIYQFAHDDEVHLMVSCAQCPESIDEIRKEFPRFEPLLKNLGAGQGPNPLISAVVRGMKRKKK